MITLNDKVWCLLDDADKSNDLKTKVDSDGNYIRTPYTLCYEIVEHIHSNDSWWADKKILVVDTVEFIPVLLTFGVNKCNITYVAPYEFKGKIASTLGVCVVQDSLLTWKTNMKFDVVIGNPPYTDGTQGANEIYTEIINRIYKLADPIILAMITPENFVNGAQKKKSVRENILRHSGFTYINFLHQDRDWNNTIKVDTVAWIIVKNFTGNVNIIGRNSGERYITKPSNEYVNGEFQRLNDWMQSIQTDKKIKLVMSKKTNKNGPELKISKGVVDSAVIINGKEYDGHNNEWRVAFGYMRANTCAIVKPGISIPTKYKYITFGDNECLARKFAAYMLSGPVRLIMKLTYTSRTLDNPQLSYIPLIDLDKIITVNDKSLFDYWKCNDISDIIKFYVGDEVPF